VGNEYKAEFNSHQKAAESKTVSFFVRISPLEKEMNEWVNFVVKRSTLLLRRTYLYPLSTVPTLNPAYQN
jgi:hypothetical protein